MQLLAAASPAGAGGAAAAAAGAGAAAAWDVPEERKLKKARSLGSLGEHVLAAGCWLLAAGCWLLAAGWPLTVFSTVRGSTSGEQPAARDAPPARCLQA